MNLVHQSEAFVDFNAPKMCACLVLKTNRHTAFAVPLQLALFAAPTSIRITGEPRPAIPALFRAFRRMARQRPIPSHRAGLPPAPARLAMLEAGFFLLRSPYAIAHSIPRKGPPVKGRAELFVIGAGLPPEKPRFRVPVKKSGPKEARIQTVSTKRKRASLRPFGGGSALKKESTKYET